MITCWKCEAQQFYKAGKLHGNVEKDFLVQENW